MLTPDVPRIPRISDQAANLNLQSHSVLYTYNMAPPPRHERYNAKARGSVAGGSSHKKRKRGSQAPKEGDDVFVEKEEPSTAASIALASEMSLQSGMGTKKRKRLESYIVSPIMPRGV